MAPRRSTTQGPSPLTILPAMALAAITSGLARYTRPGPLRPGKLRFTALTVTCSAELEELDVAALLRIAAHSLRAELQVEQHPGRHAQPTFERVSNHGCVQIH